MFSMISIDYPGDKVAFAFFFFVFWGTRLLVRIVKFVKPSFKNGIAAYFQEKKQRKLETEIHRLKNMNPEAFALELNK